jgi:intergrase/recombinase
MEVIDLKQITVRRIPDEIERMIKKEAERKGLSLNKAFLAILEKASGLRMKEKKEKALYHDLDHLSGIWSKEEAETFKRNLGLQRKINEELWKSKE